MAFPGKGAQSFLPGSHPPSTPSWARWSTREDLTLKNLSAVDDFIYRTKHLLGRGRRVAGGSVPRPRAAKAVKAECMALTWWCVPDVAQSYRVSARLRTNNAVRAGEGLDAGVAAKRSKSDPSGGSCCVLQGWENGGIGSIKTFTMSVLSPWKRDPARLWDLCPCRSSQLDRTVPE